MLKIVERFYWANGHKDQWVWCPDWAKYIQRVGNCYYATSDKTLRSGELPQHGYICEVDPVTPFTGQRKLYK
jgi:hypothetical protein